MSCCLSFALNNNGRGRLGDGGLGLADTQCLDISRGSKAEVGVDGTRVSSVDRDMTGSVNDPDGIVSISDCLVCIVLVVSLVGVCFDKCERFVVRVIDRTLGNSLMGSGGGDEGRGRDLVFRLDFLVVFGRILGSQSPGWCVANFLHQGGQAGRVRHQTFDRMAG